jgi:hypothetical protein
VRVTCTIWVRAACTIWVRATCDLGAGHLHDLNAGGFEFFYYQDFHLSAQADLVLFKATVLLACDSRAPIP